MPLWMASPTQWTWTWVNSETVRDGEARYPAVHGVAKSRTWLHFHFHFSLSCVGEGNGNPLQSFCLENPRDGGACWAAVRGVAQSRTWLKRLSSSSSSSKGMSLIHIEKVYILSRATKNDTGLYAVKLVFISTTSKLKRKGP